MVSTRELKSAIHAAMEPARKAARPRPRSAPRATGEFGNGSATLQIDALARHGLVLVRHLDDHGHAVGETVIPDDEIPSVCVTSEPCPTRACGACHTIAWRLDRVTMTRWICGRCHP